MTRVGVNGVQLKHFEHVGAFEITVLILLLLLLVTLIGT